MSDADYDDMDGLENLFQGLLATKSPRQDRSVPDPDKDMLLPVPQVHPVEKGFGPDQVRASTEASVLEFEAPIALKPIAHASWCARSLRSGPCKCATSIVELADTASGLTIETRSCCSAS